MNQSYDAIKSQIFHKTHSYHSTCARHDNFRCTFSKKQHERNEMTSSLTPIIIMMNGS